MCERWKDSFDNFVEDMGVPPTTQHTLDRENPNGDYEPDNCRWATRKEQANNRASNRLLFYNGESKTLATIAEERGINPKTLLSRLDKYGWSVERSIETPV